MSEQNHNNLNQANETISLQIIGHIYNDYAGKFGVPRQSGLVPEVVSRVVLLPEFRRAEALRGLAGFSHIWLLWLFSAGFANAGAGGEAQGWQPTVRPPRLGGNQRVGVFASRSPNRPNPIGLSAVRLLEVRQESAGPVLLVAGADVVSGTPLVDIKPYVPYADAWPEAAGGFAVPPEKARRLQVEMPPDLLALVPEAKRAALLAVLAEDPRPAYQQDGQRIYGLSFAGLNVRFQVQGRVLQVVAVERG